MQKSATGGNFTKISTKLITLFNVAKKVNIAIPYIAFQGAKNNFCQQSLGIGNLNHSHVVRAVYPLQLQAPLLNANLFYFLVSTFLKIFI